MINNTVIGSISLDVRDLRAMKTIEW